MSERPPTAFSLNPKKAKIWKSHYNRKEKIVGIFVISIALLLLSAIIVIGRGKNWFEKYNTYYTTFNESYNLKVGADVKLFKTNIGTVKAITVENKVKVKLVILEKYESRIRTEYPGHRREPHFNRVRVHIHHSGFRRCPVATPGR